MYHPAYHTAATSTHSGYYDPYGQPAQAQQAQAQQAQAQQAQIQSNYRAYQQRQAHSQQDAEYALAQSNYYNYGNAHYDQSQLPTPVREYEERETDYYNHDPYSVNHYVPENYRNEFNTVAKQYHHLPSYAASQQAQQYQSYMQAYADNLGRYAPDQNRQLPQGNMQQFDNDPYAQLRGRNLKHNDFNTYVKPLEGQDHIRSQENPYDYSYEASALNKNPYEHSSGATAFNENGYDARRSPVETHGLQTISTMNLGKPLPNAKKLVKMRKREDRALRIPMGDESKMRPIKTRKGRGRKDLRRLKRQRHDALRGVSSMLDRTPKPDTINCGWSNYQGAATWKDIDRYRRYEEEELKYLQHQQDEFSEYNYYY